MILAKEFYPVLLAPIEYEEMLWFKDQSTFDTLRGFEFDDASHAIASGYGNTHTSIAHKVRDHLGKKRCPFGTPFIVYEERHHWFWNLDDICGKEKVPFEEGARFWSPELVRDLREMIKVIES